MYALIERGKLAAREGMEDGVRVIDWCFFLGVGDKIPLLMFMFMLYTLFVLHMATLHSGA